MTRNDWTPLPGPPALLLARRARQICSGGGPVALQEAGKEDEAPTLSAAWDGLRGTLAG